MSGPVRRYLIALPFLYCLVFYGLSGVGMLSVDEPRYAAIARQMAVSGDWITPRLWGEPWFEKPALLYWMIAAATRLGLRDELAARLPVALAGLAFLLLYRWLVARQFGDRAAWYATAILATSAGWIGFSHAAVMDLPLAAAFSTAMLLAMPWALRSREKILGTRLPGAPSDRPREGSPECPRIFSRLLSGERRGLGWAGFCLGLAVLAKGLVPLILAAPLLWFGRRRLKELLPAAGILALTAAPWYVLCTAVNGRAFLDEFFWRHHFQRFGADVLMHVKPLWFFVPVLLAGLFPWTAGAALLVRRTVWDDMRLRYLMVWFAWGFVFFSAATNKLPGYLLPLLPALAAVVGAQLAERRGARWVLVITALSLLLIPVIAAVLPAALRAGLSRSALPGFPWAWLPAALALAALVLRLDVRDSRDAAVAVLAATMALSTGFLKFRTFPALDQEVSARGLWQRIAAQQDQVCVEQLHRSMRYGLNFYSVRPLPDCEQGPRRWHLRQQDNGPVEVVDAGTATSSLSPPF